jgi:glycerol-3-phosphate dehydrogenase
VYQCELDYLIAHEFVQTATDALWRRSKLGLYLTPSQQQLIGDYITEHPLQPAIAAA